MIKWKTNPGIILLNSLDILFFLFLSRILTPMEILFINLRTRKQSTVRSRSPEKDSLTFTCDSLSPDPLSGDYQVPRLPAGCCPQCHEPQWLH